MAMRESGENYLETIYILMSERGEVRSVDVANELGFSKPSVSRAVGILKKSGYITVDEGGRIRFTEDGEKRAKGIYSRHASIRTFLINVGVSETAAEDDACRIEHVISEETFEAIKRFNAKNS